MEFGGIYWNAGGIDMEFWRTRRGILEE